MDKYRVEMIIEFEISVGENEDPRYTEFSDLYDEIAEQVTETCEKKTGTTPGLSAHFTLFQER